MVIGLTRAEVKASPEYQPSSPVNRAYETRLYDYYGRTAYWRNAWPTIAREPELGEKVVKERACRRLALSLIGR